MYTTLDPKNKLSMIFIGLFLTTILFVTVNLVITAKSSVDKVIEKVNDATPCECDP